MMYSEFINLSGVTENYISYSEYSTYIEPIYTECDLSKTQFIHLMQDSFKKIVYPAIEITIHNLSMNDKLLLAVCCSDSVRNMTEKVDFEARKIAYQYMKLYSNL